MKESVLIFTICFTIFSLYLKINKKLPCIFDSNQKNISALIDNIDLEYVKIFKNNIDSLEYLRVMNEIVIKRFNHGFYMYDFADNFVLYIFCLITDLKHRGIVHPNHLAQGNIGICSQQSIICMAIAQQKGYQTRAVKLNKHYICEVFAKGTWHILDTDLNLTLLDKKIIPSAEDLQKNKLLLEDFYLKSIHYENKKLASKFFNTINYGKINTFDAPNLILLHKATFLLSDYLWVIIWILYYTFFINKKLKFQTNILTKTTHE